MPANDLLPPPQRLLNLQAACSGRFACRSRLLRARAKGEMCEKCKPAAGNTGWHFRQGAVYDAIVNTLNYNTSIEP
jgi:hypothetical protein